MKSLATLILIMIVGLGLCDIGWGQSLGTVFTYQGKLSYSGSPTAGEYDFEFKLHADADADSQVGPTRSKENVKVEAGTFTVTLDFGNVFDGQKRWLEISVRPGDESGDYVTLSPRQELMATPYAMYALHGPGSAGFWAANGNHIYNTNISSIGIGTSNPSNKLHVLGDMRIDETSPYLNFFSGATQKGFIGIWTNDDMNVINKTESGSLKFGTNSYERMRINETGNVGIGTTIPAGRLHVGTPPYSDIIFFDAGGGLDDLSVDTSSAYTDSIDRIYIVEVIDSSSSPNLFFWSDDNGITWSVEFGMTTSWFDLSHGVRIKWDDVDGHNDGGALVGDRWAWVAFSSFENVLVVKEGKVGIGTSNPAWELEVANLKAGGGAESAVKADDAGGAIAAYSSTLPFPHYAGRVSLFSDAGTMGLDLRADSSTSDIRFYTGGFAPSNERMRIAANGFIGIGTTDPAFQLEVLGDRAADGVAYFQNQNTAGHADGITIQIGPDENPTGGNMFIVFRDGDQSIVGHVNGNYSGGINYNTTSDARLKTNIVDFNEGLDVVSRMKIRNYEMISTPGIKRVGFLAQELMAVYPQAVSGSPDSDVNEEPMMIDYGKLTPILAQAIQQLKSQVEKNTDIAQAQQKIIDEQTQKINQLTEKIDALTERMEALESR